ncbi:G2/M phase-specific E3 ubiquitin-protein ligase-like [Tropilaelaps mercedesae]|uniref:G2/M phase-specific E3 ubiquitin-protein ligase-like n=1 Tax=Tropilaelaps mercedesae TaxID=418985 RepID=A0A1V9XJ21_9ACAR|nr:G2/M phase-specific E3 ubiquitin-protein ligase-like [Tropilaelaps mercedesae]
MAASRVEQGAKGKCAPRSGLKDTCAFCKRKITTEDELKFGTRESSTKFTVHYFCVLLATHLQQHGEDDEGIKGFLEADIHKELRRARKSRCFYCHAKGAAVSCAKSSCRRVFHFPCGFEAGAVPDFNSTSLDVYCRSHAPTPTTTPLLKQDGTAECLVCLDQLEVDLGKPPPPELLVSPCCRQLYEKNCLRGYARSAGLHHFKCSQCRNTDEFLYVCRQNGIFVPDQDAEWERNNDFADHYVPHNTCDVPICLCPEGRSTIDGHNDWEVVRCDDCGKSGTHIKCRNLTEGPLSAYKCSDCETIGAVSEVTRPVSSNVRWYQASKLHAASSSEDIVVLEKASTENEDDVVDVDDSQTAGIDNKENGAKDARALVVHAPHQADGWLVNAAPEQRHDRNASGEIDSHEASPLDGVSRRNSSPVQFTPSKSPPRAFRQLSIDGFASPINPVWDRATRGENCSAGIEYPSPSSRDNTRRPAYPVLALTYSGYDRSPPKKRVRRKKLQRGQTTLDAFFNSRTPSSMVPTNSRCLSTNETARIVATHEWTLCRPKTRLGASSCTGDRPNVTHSSPNAAVNS